VLHKNIVEEYVLGQIVGAETLPGNMGIPNIWQLEKKGNGSNTDSLVMMRKPKMVLIKTMVAMERGVPGSTRVTMQPRKEPHPVYDSSAKNPRNYDPDLHESHP